MKRTPMPASTTPLTRRTRLRYRKLDHAATGQPVQRTTLVEWEGIRGAQWERCGGHCEACDGRLTDIPGWQWQSNHRKLEGQGGATDLTNLVATHPRCHVMSPYAIHHEPAWAMLVRGLLVPSWADPAAVPLVLPDGRRVLLGDGYTPAPDLPAGACPAPPHAGEHEPATVRGLLLAKHTDADPAPADYCAGCARALARAGWFAVAA